MCKDIKYKYFMNTLFYIYLYIKEYLKDSALVQVQLVLCNTQTWSNRPPRLRCITKYRFYFRAKQIFVWPTETCVGCLPIIWMSVKLYSLLRLYALNGIQVPIVNIYSNVYLVSRRDRHFQMTSSFQTNKVHFVNERYVEL